MLYQNWTHNVIRRRVRVLPGSTGSPCYGPSMSALILRSGAIGTIMNILPENSTMPSYVKFSGHKLDCTHAAEVLLSRSDNAGVMWKDFANMHVQGDETMVLVTYRALVSSFEIEYEG